MAAFQRLFRATAAPTAAVGAALLATATVASADIGPELAIPGRSANGEKLPIYSTPENDEIVTLVVSHNPLAEHIATARQATAGVVGQARGVVEKGVSRWIDVERSIEREVKQIIPKDESLTPGIIYVLVAGLTGSVITRTRSFPLRFLTPPAFALAALPYFLPKTAHNLRAYISDVEDKHAPEFAASHDQFNSNLELHWQMVRDRLHGVGHEARQWSSKAAEGVESATGLRVSDAVRRGRQDLHEAKERVAQTSASLREKAKADIAAAVPATPAPVVEPVVFETVGTVVEQKPIAEIVVPVASVVEEPAPVAVAPVAVAPPVVVPVAAPTAVVVEAAEPKTQVREVDAGVKPKPKPTERLV